MHIVIADDLTGAAEIAGVGLSRGLRGMVSTTISADYAGDLWCFATDTRSNERQNVGNSIIHYTSILKQLGPEIFYKKIDSVLRGNVMQVSEAFAKAQDLDRVLIIPANPSLKRIIKDGTYFIDGVPLSEIDYFKNKKPSSKLLDLIAPAYRDRTRVIKELSELDAPGFYFGEVAAYADLLKWASLSDQAVALCGGSDFFDALLQYHGYPLQTVQQSNIPFGERQLFVQGSAVMAGDRSFHGISDQGFGVSNMPWRIFTNSAFSAEDIEQWTKEILRFYQTSNKLVITMNYKELPFEERPHLKIALGELVYALIQRIQIDELFVEGGATSYAILQKLRADRLLPIQSLARGVTRMELFDNKSLRMTVKPGSYKWPATVWPELSNIMSK